MNALVDCSVEVAALGGEARAHDLGALHHELDRAAVHAQLGQQIRV